MKFSIDSVASATEIDSARRSTERATAIAKIVVWSSVIVLLALVYPFGKWFAGQIPPLAPDSSAVSATVWVFQSGLLILGACASFVVAGLSLARWPFAKVIELNRTLQPLEDYEARDLVKITEALPELDEYRRAVAAVRGFVKGDFDLIRDQEQKALKLAREAEQEKERQAIFAKLHRVE